MLFRSWSFLIIFFLNSCLSEPETNRNDQKTEDAAVSENSELASCNKQLKYFDSFDQKCTDMLLLENCDKAMIDQKINENGFSSERIDINDTLSMLDERIKEGYQISQCGLSFNQDVLSSIAAELSSGTTTRIITINLEQLQARQNLATRARVYYEKKAECNQRNLYYGIPLFERDINKIINSECSNLTLITDCNLDTVKPLLNQDHFDSLQKDLSDGKKIDQCGEADFTLQVSIVKETEGLPDQVASQFFTKKIEGTSLFKDTKNIYDAYLLGKQECNTDNLYYQVDQLSLIEDDFDIGDIECAPLMKLIPSCTLELLEPLMNTDSFLSLKERVTEGVKIDQCGEYEGIFEITLLTEHPSPKPPDVISMPYIGAIQ